MKAPLMVILAAFAAISLMAQEQTTPPVPAAPRPVNLPKPVEHTLTNGLRIVVVHKTGAPIVAARLMVKTGGAADPASRGGLADLTASLLTKGTASRSARQVAEGVEALGATLETSAAWDSSAVDLNVLNIHFAKALEFVADIVRHPKFSADELDRLRVQNIDSLHVALRQPANLARLVATRSVFAGSPYGHNLGGTPESLQRITRADIAKFHSDYYRPENSVLIVAGDLPSDTVFSTAEKLFGDWKRAAGEKATIQVTVPVAATAGAPAPAPKVIVVDLPDSGQAAVVVEKRGLRRADQSYSVSQVANSILGGGYSSRLNEEIRIKRGLSYGAGSQFDLRREAGPFTSATQTKNESAAEVAGIIVDELQKMSSAPVNDEELGPRKAVLIGGFGRTLETSSGLVAHISTLALHGLGLDEISHYIAGIQGVDAAGVQNFASTYMTSSGTTVVVVGDSKQFIEPLRKRFGAVEVIPIDKVDLDGAK